MSKDDSSRSDGPGGGKIAGKPKRTRKTLVRKTRYLALEPRIVFDGALAADIVDNTTHAAGDATKNAPDAVADKTLPAVDWAQTSVPAITALDGKSATSLTGADKAVADSAAADKAAADKATDAANKAIDDRALQIPAEFSSGRTEVVFVDVTVRDFQTLLQDISPNTRVVMLDASRDAVAQIADVMAQYQAGTVDAIHLITHGNEGQIDFGSGSLNATTMRTTYADALAKIGQSMTAEGDILVYGCDFGKGEVGQDAAATLAQLTGADVAASTNATGDATLGGDWNLELHDGKIETSIIVDRYAQEQYHDLLAVHTLDFDAVGNWTSGTAPGSYVDYTVDGYPVRIKIENNNVFGTPTLASNYSGGVAPAQNALQFVVGSAAQSTITIDFSGQPGGTVSNVGFALYDVDNVESADFTANKAGVGAIAPTNIATSAYNSVTAMSATSATVSGSGSDSTSTTAYGNTYVYFNTTGLTSVSFTYHGTANITLVVLNDITFFGASSNPPVLDLDSSSSTTVTAGDNFAVSGSYTNTTAGSLLPWVAPWVETDTGGAGAAAGQVRVVTSPVSGADSALRLNNSGTAGQFTGVTRQIDLSGVSNSMLDFDYITTAGLTATGSAADAVVLEVSTNGGTNWTTLKTYTGSTTSTTSSGSPAYTHDSVSIAGYESADTVVRFRVSGTAAYTGAAEYFYVDNVQMTALPTGSANTYIEGDTTGVLIASAANATVTDVDSASMASAKVTIDSALSGDVLTFSTAGISVPGAITGSYDAVTGVLTLTGTASKADYQTVFNTIRFKNTSDDPTAGGTRTTRNIAAVVTDSGFNEGNTATSLITVTGVNDAPVNSVSGAQSTIANAPIIFSSANGNQVSVSDPDATGNVQVTLSATGGGAITLSGTAGLSFAFSDGNGTGTGDGTEDATMTFRGSLAAVNAALAGMSYNSAAPGSSTLSITTNDLGGSGTGGALVDTDTIAINVLPANVLDLNSTPTVTSTSTSAVSDLVVNGDMTLNAGGVPSNWAEGGDVADGAWISRNGALRYDWTGASGSATPTATLTQSIAVPTSGTTTAYFSTGTSLVETKTVTTNAVTSISVDLAWQNSDTAKDNTLQVSYNGVVYAEFSTGKGSGANGSWTYPGGLATGTVTTLAAVTDERDGTLSTNVITFASPVASSGDLVFTYKNGPTTTGGSDDVAIDNVKVYSAALSTTTVTTIDLADNAWTATFVENDPVGVSIADTDSSVYNGSSPNLASGVVTLTNFKTSDQLLVNGSTGSSGSIGTINWTRSGTNGEIITLNGAASRAAYADAVELIRFRNTSDAPDTTDRIVTVKVNDGTIDSNTAIATIHVTSVNDAPTLSAPASFAVTEDVAGNLVYTGTPFADVDSGTLTVTLSIPDGTVAGNPGTGITLGGTGTARTFTGTVADLNTYFTTAGKITYTTAQDNNAARTLTTQVSDGSLSASTTSTISITPVNDPPVADLNAGGAGRDVTTAFVEQTPVLIAPVATLTDVDSANLTSLQVTLTARPDGNAVESLSLNPAATAAAGGAGLTVNYTVGTGVLSITGSATKAVYQTVLQGIQYNDTSDTPTTSSRTISVVVNDGATVSATQTVTLTVAAVNDAPVADLNAGGAGRDVTTAFVEQTPVLIAPIATLTDVDSANLTSLQVTLTTRPDGNAVELLSLNAAATAAASGAGLTVGYTAGTGVLSITGSATKAVYQAVLQGIQYNDTSDTPTTSSRSITVVANDGATVSTTQTVTLTVAAVNDAPTLSVPASFGVTEDVAGNLVYTGTPFSDVDSGTLTVTLSIPDGTVSGTAGTGVTVGGTGTARTFTGTVADLNAYFTTTGKITYTTAQDNNATRTLTTQVSDGSLTASTTSTINIAPVNDAPVRTAGSVASLTISEDAPMASLGLGSVTYGPGGAAAEAAQTLSYMVTLIPDPALGTIYLADGVTAVTASTTYSLADIRGMQFTAAPDANGTGTFTYSVKDSGGTANGGVDTLSESVSITVNPVNDAPENTAASNYNTPKDVPLTFSGLQGNAISVLDVDSPTLTVTLTAANGRITLFSTAGLAFSNGDGTSDASMTFSGTQADINAALDGMFFDPNTGYIGAASLTIDTSDGTAPVATDTIVIAVTTQPPRLDLADGSADRLATDGFDTGGYAGVSGGAIPWAGDWIESDAAGNPQDASAGDVQIASNRIVLGDPSGSGGSSAGRAAIQRTVDLSQYINATLSFNLSTSGNVDNTDRYVVEASTDGGVTFSILKSYRNDVYSAETISLSGYESSNTVIRFRLTSNFSSNEFVYIDDVTITAQPTDYTADYTENGSGVSISAIPKITDSDSTTLAGATITLTNAQSGDLLTAGSMPAGITASVVGNVVTLSTTSGAPTLSDYQNAINAIQFSNSGDNPDTTDRSVTVVLEGDYGALSNVATTTIHVHAVNDAPTLTTMASTVVTAIEDQQAKVTFADLQTQGNEADVDGTVVAFVVKSVSSGTLLIGTSAGTATAWVAGVNDTIDATHQAFWTGAQDANGALGAFTVVARDDGGLESLTGAVQVLVDVTAVNDAPAGADRTVTLLEDGAYVFTAADFGFSDAQDAPADSLLAVRISTLPGSGTLTLAGVGALVSGDTVLAADIAAGKLVFSPEANASGTGYASFSFRVQDSGGTANGGVDLATSATTITLDVTAVNDAPDGADSTVTMLEDGIYTFTVSDFGFSDVLDAGGPGGANSLQAVRISTVPGAGMLTLAGSGPVGAGNFVSAADIAAGKLQFSPAPDANGTGYASFTFQVQDSGGTANGGVNLDATANVLTVDVTAVNDAATVSSADVALAETNAAVSTGGTLTSTDVDNAANAFTPVTTVGTIGTFALDASGAWTFTANSAFDSLNVGQNVNETFTVSSVDGTTSAVKITINGTNDAATVTTEVVVVPFVPVAVPPSSPLPPIAGPTPSDAATQASGIPPLSSSASGATSDTSHLFVDPALISQPVNLAGDLGGGVPAGSVFAPASGESSAASIVNALPATAAGLPTGIPLTSAADQSFQVVLISSTGSDPGNQAASATGARLFVLEGVPDVQADKQFQLSAEAFAHTDQSALITLEARQSNGEPLPGWLQFNQASGTFSGSPPDGNPSAVEVQVIAHDNQAREASVIFKLELGVTGAGNGTAVVATVSGAVDRGFPVTRIGTDSSSVADIGLDSAQTLGGNRLFVLEGVTSAVGGQEYQLPQSAFAHTDSKAVVTLEARQSNGAPLPAWLQFDPVTGLFRGAPPDGKSVAIDVVVVAHDGEAREASVVFQLELGVPGADAHGATPLPGAVDSALRQGAGGTGSGQETGGDASRPRASLDSGMGGLQSFADANLSAQQTAFAEASAAAGLGFPVARVPGQDLLRVAGSEGLSGGDEHLFVYQGIFTARGEDVYQVPLDAFGHSDPSAIVHLEARGADGSPLPFWLHFDSLTGTFRGTPPGGQRTLLEVVLTARDEEGREASLEFTLELGVKIADEAPVKAESAPDAPSPRARADADDGDAGADPNAVAVDGTDGADGEKDIVEHGKPVRVGAAPFGEQIKAEKIAKDPLLAKILGGNDKRGGRPIL